MNKDKIYLVIILGLILGLGFMYWKITAFEKNALAQTELLKKSIIDSDKLAKEGEGHYSKLVDYYSSEKNMMEDLKKSNKELHNVIKSQDEKILNLSSAVVTLKGMVAEGFGKFNPNDSNQIDIGLKYPSEKDPFIMWNGYVNKKNAHYRGNWQFGKLPISIVVTEEKRGLWKHQIVGPDWFIVDSLTVKSIPPIEYSPVEEAKVQFIFGGNYMRSLVAPTNQSVGIGFGANILRQHNLIVMANTNKEIGVGYYYIFKKLKQKK